MRYGDTAHDPLGHSPVLHAPLCSPSSMLHFSMVCAAIQCNAMHYQQSVPMQGSASRPSPPLWTCSVTCNLVAGLLPREVEPSPDHIACDIPGIHMFSATSAPSLHGAAWTSLSCMTTNIGPFHTSVIRLLCRALAAAHAHTHMIEAKCHYVPVMLPL